MTDTVQVPREATEEMIDAGWKHVTAALCAGKYGHLHDLYRAMIAAAPQATDPRIFEKWDEAKGKFVLTTEATDPRDAEIERLKARRECHLSTMGALAIERDAAESRIATLTAERDEALAALTVARKYVAVAQHSPNALHEYRLEARCFLSEIDALTTQPSKTEPETKFVGPKGYKLISTEHHEVICQFPQKCRWPNCNCPKLEPATQPSKTETRDDG